MADKQLRFVITGKDSGASAALKGVGDHAQSVGSRIGGAFSKLGGQIGGEFGDVLNTVGEGFDKLGEKGTSRLQKLGAAGAGLAAVGGLLTAMGDKEKAASQQLDQAITNSGHSADDFSKQIEDTVHHMERYGISAIHTKDALTTLTNATHDPKKAIDLMGVAADLAAAKHIDLNSAATQLARGLNGSAKVFKQYGIQVATNADGTKDYAGAVDRLAQVVHGQASAAADTFTGKLKALRTEVTDNVSAFGAKFGPAITAAGVGFMVMAPLLSAAGGAIKRVGSSFITTGAEAEAGAAGVAAADTEIVAGNEAAAASGNQLAASQGRGKLAALGMAGGVAALGVGVAMLGFTISKHLQQNSTWGNAMVDLKGASDKLTTALVNNAGSTDDAAKQWIQGHIAAQGLADKAAKVGITVDQMTAAVQGGGDATMALIDQWKKTGKPSGDTIAALMMLQANYEKGTAAAAAHAAATAHVSSAVSDQARWLGTSDTALTTANATEAKNAETLKKQTLAMQMANDAAGLLAQGFDRLTNKNISSEQANIAFLDSEHAVTTAVKQNGKSLSDNTTNGRANRSAVLSSIQAAQAHAEAVGKQTGSVNKATGAYRTDITALRTHLTQIGLNTNEVDALIRKYGGLPKIKITKLDAQDYATAKARALKRQLDALHDKTVRVTLEAIKGNVGAGVRFTAGGSDFFPGGETTIAEREPEAIYLPRGAQVKPLSSMGHGGGSQTINVQIVSPQVWAGNEAELARHLAGLWGRTGIKIPATAVGN
jgi:hypothetical protein